VACAITLVTRTVRTAAGVFAPGHLGELTQIVPFEMVDAVLAETGSTERRVRELPSRVVVYLLLAAGLFAELGYRQVWSRLVSGWDAAGPVPSSSALAQARRRVGVEPLKALFELLAGPPAGAVRWRGLLVCAIDGTTMSVPDSPANLGRYGHQTGSHGGSGYPLVRLLAVVACGTRTLLGVTFGPFRPPSPERVHSLKLARLPQSRGVHERGAPGGFRSGHRGISPARGALFCPDNGFRRGPGAEMVSVYAGQTRIPAAARRA
jgi:Insertion element 4 transposase N-terminal